MSVHKVSRPDLDSPNGVDYLIQGERLKDKLVSCLPLLDPVLYGLCMTVCDAHPLENGLRDEIIRLSIHRKWLLSTHPQGR